jgi:hypothetical protein
MYSTYIEPYSTIQLMQLREWLALYIPYIEICTKTVIRMLCFLCLEASTLYPRAYCNMPSHVILKVVAHLAYYPEL